MLCAKWFKLIWTTARKFVKRYVIVIVVLFLPQRHWKFCAGTATKQT